MMVAFRIDPADHSLVQYPEGKQTAVGEQHIPHMAAAWVPDYHIWFHCIPDHSSVQVELSGNKQADHSLHLVAVHNYNSAVKVADPS